MCTEQLVLDIVSTGYRRSISPLLRRIENRPARLAAASSARLGVLIRVFEVRLYGSR